MIWSTSFPLDFSAPSPAFSNLSNRRRISLWSSFRWTIASVDVRVATMTGSSRVGCGVPEVPSTAAVRHLRSGRIARMRLVDLSHTIVDGLVTYPGLPGPAITDHLSFEDSH